MTTKTIDLIAIVFGSIGMVVVTVRYFVKENNANKRKFEEFKRKHLKE